MTKNSISLIHPGEILSEMYLLTLGVSANALSVGLRVNTPRINEIVHEHSSKYINFIFRSVAACNFLNLNSIPPI